MAEVNNLTDSITLKIENKSINEVDIEFPKKQTLTNTTDPAESTENENETEKEEQVDPRVKIELEVLNETATRINNLENSLEMAKNNFRISLNDASQVVNELFKKLKRHAIKAKPYYESLKEAKKAHADAQKSAKEFHSAMDHYRAAKETVCIAEKRLNNELKEIAGTPKKNIDPAWQEMINHATIKFMDAENKKTQTEELHKKKAEIYSLAQQNVRSFEKKIASSIVKSKPYFDTKAKLEWQLEKQKIEIELILNRVKDAKKKYSECLLRLECISEDIRKKQTSRYLLPIRTPGVGAEVDQLSEFGSVNLDYLDDNLSEYSTDRLSDSESINSDIDYRNQLTSSPLHSMVSNVLTADCRSRSNLRNRDTHSAPVSGIQSPVEELTECYKNRRPRIAGRSSSRKSLVTERVLDNHPLAFNINTETATTSDSLKGENEKCGIVKNDSFKKKVSQGVLLTVGHLNKT